MPHARRPGRATPGGALGLALCGALTTQPWTRPRKHTSTHHNPDTPSPASLDIEDPAGAFECRPYGTMVGVTVLRGSRGARAARAPGPTPHDRRAHDAKPRAIGRLPGALMRARSVRPAGRRPWRCPAAADLASRCRQSTSLGQLPAGAHPLCPRGASRTPRRRSDAGAYRR